MRKGRIDRLSTTAQHHTLICELDSGEGSGNSFDVQSFDDRGAPVSSCYDDFSRGFFYPNYTSIQRVAASSNGDRSVITLNETSHLRNTGLPMGLFQKG